MKPSIISKHSSPEQQIHCRELSNSFTHKLQWLNLFKKASFSALNLKNENLSSFIIRISVKRHQSGEIFGSVLESITQHHLQCGCVIPWSIPCEDSDAHQLRYISTWTMTNAKWSVALLQRDGGEKRGDVWYQCDLGSFAESSMFIRMHRRMSLIIQIHQYMDRHARWCCIQTIIEPWATCEQYNEQLAFIS